MYQSLPQIPLTWQTHLRSCQELEAIDKKLASSHKVIFPKKEAIFKALELTSFEDVKVVFMGQDPYHGPLEACGLCFGVPEGVAVPPSLRNLIKELESDLDQVLESTTLAPWALQGVLLLNRSLTVFEHEPLSHKDWGWDRFIDRILRALLREKKELVMVALGRESENFFKSYASLFHQRHRLLCFTHPSPLSAHRGFFGSKLYSKINQALVSLDQEPIRFGNLKSSVCSRAFS